LVVGRWRYTTFITSRDVMPQIRNSGVAGSALRRSERGYILLMLMLFVALLAIAAGALAPTMAFRVRRDREEEMIHRGTQYSRAIRRYVKKTGRYPSRLEELENTNNIRFLRKRYKDPITNKDFKLLHVGDVQLTGAAGIAGAAALGGGTIPGAAAVGAMGQGASPMGGAGASSMTGSNRNQAGPGATATATGAGDDSSQDAGQSKPDVSGTGQSPSPSEQGQSGSGDKLSSQVFGGGPIVGVASISKAQSIREFNHKNHYDKWQFIYDPTMDRGGLITTPAQPALQVAPPLQQNSSASGSGFGSGQNSSSFGAGSGALGFSNSPQSPPPVQPTQQQQ
jgi:type II secretory pathway pseudopilin PulG